MKQVIVLGGGMAPSSRSYRTTALVAGLVAAGSGNRLRELCADRSGTARDLDGILDAAAIRGDRRMLEDLLRDDADRARLLALVERYLRTEFHGIYHARAESVRRRGELPFLTRFFGTLATLTAETLDIYVQPEALKRGDRSSWSWRIAEVPALSAAVLEHAAQHGPEDALLVWRRDEFRPQALGLGRFTPESRVAAVATLVTHLQAQVPLAPAVAAAQASPGDVRHLPLPLPAADGQVDPQLVRRWQHELRHRDREHPDAGYREAAALLGDLLAQSPARRVFADARVRTICALLTGAIALSDQVHSAVVDAPETWRHLVDVIQSDAAPPARGDAAR